MSSSVDVDEEMRIANHARTDKQIVFHAGVQ